MSCIVLTFKLDGGLNYWYGLSGVRKGCFKFIDFDYDFVITVSEIHKIANKIPSQKYDHESMY